MTLLALLAQHLSTQAKLSAVTLWLDVQALLKNVFLLFCYCAVFFSVPDWFLGLSVVILLIINEFLLPSYVRQTLTLVLLLPVLVLWYPIKYIMRYVLPPCLHRSLFILRTLLVCGATDAVSTKPHKNSCDRSHSSPQTHSSLHCLNCLFKSTVPSEVSGFSLYII